MKMQTTARLLNLLLLFHGDRCRLPPWPTMTQPTDTPGLPGTRTQRRRSGRGHHGSPDHAVSCFRPAQTRPGRNGRLLSFSFSSRKSHPATPLVQWRSTGAFPPVSARKLAAELWGFQRSYAASEEGNRRRLEVDDLLYRSTVILI